MKDLLYRFLSSKKASLWLLLIYAVLMVLATLVEKYQGTPTAKALIYYSPLFFLIHLLMIANFIGITLKHRLYKAAHWVYLCVHGSLIVILLGATVTHFFSKEGMLHLREGEKTNQVVLKGRGQEVLSQLPFEIELTNFKLLRYPGSQSPSSYESLLKLYVDGETRTQKVFMNNVLDLKGYRFYQASYDSDESGSILSVSHDTVGRRITYFGYGILFFGLIATFFNKHSRFRRLGKLLKKGVVCIGGITILSALLTGPLNAADNSTGNTYRATHNTHAVKLGELPSQSTSGRIVPLHTLASEMLRKVYGNDHYKEFTAEQFLLAVLAYPEQWVDQPLIKIKHKELPPSYQWNTDYISYRDGFDANGSYLLEKEVEEIYRKNPAQRSIGEKEVLKLDEKINILHLLFRFQLLRIFPLPDDMIDHQWFAPGDDLFVYHKADALSVSHLFEEYRREIQEAFHTDEWKKADVALANISSFQQQHNTGLDLSEKRMRTEVKYNKLDLTKVCRIGYLIVGFLLLLVSFYQPKNQSPKKINYFKLLKSGIVTTIVLFLILHTYNMGMRWYLSGYAPWSNSYETMVAMAWASVLGGLLLGRRDLTAMALATLFGGIALFVSGLSWMDPQISPLVPVLKSPWLTFHVAVLIASYGFLGISCMIGATNLILYPFATGKDRPSLTNRINRLTIINEMALIAGLIFLMIGIFLGAIWANESWGRYWSWDPKETWALITAIVYSLVLHYRWFSDKKQPWNFNLYSQLAFLAVLMTFLGVNYFLSGMHSYGNTSGLSGLSLVAIGLLVGFFILPGVLSYLLVRKQA